MLTSHPSAALEYWFFKVNAGPTALLVDWIEKRRLGERLVRGLVLAEQQVLRQPQHVQRAEHHAGDAAMLDVGVGEQPLELQRQLVGGPLANGLQPPAADQFLALEHTEHDVRVADVDGEQHRQT